MPSSTSPRSRNIGAVAFSAGTATDNEVPPTGPPAGITLADDLLTGADAIGEFLFGEDPGARRKVYHLTGEVKPEDRLPVFKMGAILCARKSTLLGWIADREGITPVTGTAAV
jgi:hypothetical protein